MKKHGFLFASAGFWYLLRFAASYYLITSLRDPAMSQADKLETLWFGSPALIVAGIFFMLYFRPGQYVGLLGLGRLSLGLGMVVSAFTAAAILASNLMHSGYPLETSGEIMVLVFLAMSVAIDLAFFLLTKNKDDQAAEVR